MTLSGISILGSGSYLPGDPVAPEQVEDILGPIDDLSPRLAGRVDRFRDRLLSRSGVTSRFFAIDPETRRQTETNASMSEKASRKALQAAETDPSEIDLLICANPGGDCFTPPTTALIQEQLGVGDCNEIEIHSNCTGAPKGMQIAIDGLRVGRYRRALVIYSQLSSFFLRREFLNPQKLTLENLTLRWMLSDGAAAIVLGRSEDGDGRPEMIDAYVESVGHNHAPGMLMEFGAKSGTDLAHLDTPYMLALFEQGRHHLWQDVSSVSKESAGFAVDGLARMLQKLEVSPSDIATYVLPFPGRHFLTEQARDYFSEKLAPFSESIVPFRCSEFGYCGGAASLVQFDRMAREGCFRPDDLVTVYVEESSKWMSGGFLVRWR